MNAQYWQAVAGIIAAYAALFAGIWAVITRPIENRFTDMTGNMTARFAEVTSALKRIEDKLTKIEEKLNDHGERITRLEERRFH